MDKKLQHALKTWENNVNNASKKGIKSFKSFDMHKYLSSMIECRDKYKKYLDRFFKDYINIRSSDKNTKAFFDKMDAELEKYCKNIEEALVKRDIPISEASKQLVLMKQMVGENGKNSLIGLMESLRNELNDYGNQTSRLGESYNMGCFNKYCSKLSTFSMQGTIGLGTSIGAVIGTLAGYAKEMEEIEKYDDYDISDAGKTTAKGIVAGATIGAVVSGSQKLIDTQSERSVEKKRRQLAVDRFKSSNNYSLKN